MKPNRLLQGELSMSNCACIPGKKTMANDERDTRCCETGLISEESLPQRRSRIDFVMPAAIDSESGPGKPEVVEPDRVRTLPRPEVLGEQLPVRRHRPPDEVGEHMSPKARIAPTQGSSWMNPDQPATGILNRSTERSTQNGRCRGYTAGQYGRLGSLWHCNTMTRATPSTRKTLPVGKVGPTGISTVGQEALTQGRGRLSLKNLTEVHDPLGAPAAGEYWPYLTESDRRFDLNSEVLGYIPSELGFGSAAGVVGAAACPNPPRAWEEWTWTALISEFPNFARQAQDGVPISQNNRGLPNALLSAFDAETRVLKDRGWPAPTIESARGARVRTGQAGTGFSRVVPYPANRTAWARNLNFLVDITTDACSSQRGGRQRACYRSRSCSIQMTNDANYIAGMLRSRDLHQSNVVAHELFHGVTRSLVPFPTIAAEENDWLTEGLAVSHECTRIPAAYLPELGMRNWTAPLNSLAAARIAAGAGVGVPLSLAYEVGEFWLALAALRGVSMVDFVPNFLRALGQLGAAGTGILDTFDADAALRSAGMGPLADGFRDVALARGPTGAWVGGNDFTETGFYHRLVDVWEATILQTQGAAGLLVENFEFPAFGGVPGLDPTLRTPQMWPLAANCFRVETLFQGVQSQRHQMVHFRAEHQLALYYRPNGSRVWYRYATDPARGWVAGDGDPYFEPEGPYFTKYVDYVVVPEGPGALDPPTSIPDPDWTWSVKVWLE